MFLRYWPINLTTSLSLVENEKPAFLEQPGFAAINSPFKWLLDSPPFCTETDPFVWRCISVKIGEATPSPVEDLQQVLRFEALGVKTSTKDCLALFRGGGVCPPGSDSELDARLALGESEVVCKKANNTTYSGFSFEIFSIIIFHWPKEKLRKWNEHNPEGA